jgi:hypothetical protein
MKKRHSRAEFPPDLQSAYHRARARQKRLLGISMLFLTCLFLEAKKDNRNSFGADGLFLSF